MRTKKTIAIVDDHDLFRKGIISLFKEFPEIQILIESGDGQDLLNQMKTKQPDVILLDISMPEMDGIQAIDKIKRKYPDVKVIMLTQYTDEQTIYHLMEKDANGFLPKSADIETIVDAIYSVVDKGYYFTDTVSKAMVKGASNRQKSKPGFHTPSLSPREIEVVKLICKQMSIIEIGQKLCLSPRTIDSYIKNIYEKTGAKKREGIVIYAAKNNLIN